MKACIHLREPVETLPLQAKNFNNSHEQYRKEIQKEIIHAIIGKLPQVKLDHNVKDLAKLEKNNE